MLTHSGGVEEVSIESEGLCVGEGDVFAFLVDSVVDFQIPQHNLRLSTKEGIRPIFESFIVRTKFRPCHLGFVISERNNE